MADDWARKVWGYLEDAAREQIRDNPEVVLRNVAPRAGRPGVASLTTFVSIPADPAEAAATIRSAWEHHSAGGPGETVPPEWVWAKNPQTAAAVAEEMGCRIATAEELAEAKEQARKDFPNDPMLR